MPMFKVTVLEHLNHQLTVEAPSEDLAMAQAKTVIFAEVVRSTATTSVTLLDAIDVEPIDDPPPRDACTRDVALLVRDLLEDATLSIHLENEDEGRLVPVGEAKVIEIDVSDPAIAVLTLDTGQKFTICITPGRA